MFGLFIGSTFNTRNFVFFPKNRASETWVLHNACVLGEALNALAVIP